MCSRLQEHTGKYASAHRAATAIGLLLAGMDLLAADSLHRADKSRYHLFRPTPRPLLRDLSTDRPDKTESPYTVDAGHFQLEMDLFQYAHDRENRGGSDIRTETWTVAPVNVKVGLLNDLDLQFVSENYIHTRQTTRTRTEAVDGFGDLATRMKLNVFGNDSGGASLAVMPYAKWPTASAELGNGRVEGGLILPFAADLPARWGLGLMAQFDAVRDASNTRYDARFIHTITVQHPLVGPLEAYLEFYSELSTDAQSEWIATVDLGLTWGLTDNLQLDGGVNVGVTRAADDVNPFLGLTVRY